MKFEVAYSSTPTVDLKYPCLMRSTNTDHVVLFTEREEGMELAENGFEEPSEWVPADRPGEWVPFEGTITVKK